MLPSGAQARGDAVCLPRSRSVQFVIVTGPMEATPPPAGAPPHPVLLTRDADPVPGRRRFPVFVDGGEGLPVGPDRVLDFRGGGRVLTDLPAYRIREIRIDVPAFNAFCLRRIRVTQAIPQAP